MKEIGFKRLVSLYAPPVFRSFFNRLLMQNIVYEGPFNTWNEAIMKSDGYSSDIIFQKAKYSALKVKSKEYAYEQDSVLYGEISYTYHILLTLYKAALVSNGKLVVLDYGGSLGSTYYRCRDMLNDISNLKWCIIEQEKYVECGKDLFEDEVLKFYYKLDECFIENVPNVVILSSVLQYLEHPYELIQELCIRNIKYLIIDRTPVTTERQDTIVIQKVPSNIYKASYPAWIFNKDKLLNTVKNYHLQLSYKTDDGFIKCGKITGQYQGFIFSNDENN